MKILCNELMEELNKRGHILSPIKEAFKPDGGDTPVGYIEMKSDIVVNKMDEGLRTSGLGGIDGLRIWKVKERNIGIGIEAKVNNVISKIGIIHEERTSEEEADKYFILKYCVGLLTKYMEMDKKIDGTNERLRRADLSEAVNVEYTLFVDAFHKEEYLRNAPQMLKRLQHRDILIREYFHDVESGVYKPFTTKKGKEYIPIVCEKIDEFDTVFVRKQVEKILT